MTEKLTDGVTHMEQACRLGQCRFLRYGLPEPLIQTLWWDLQDMNDDIAHGRDHSIIRARAESMKAMLDRLADGERS